MSREATTSAGGGRARTFSALLCAFLAGAVAVAAFVPDRRSAAPTTVAAAASASAASADAPTAAADAPAASTDVAAPATGGTATAPSSAGAAAPAAGASTGAGRTATAAASGPADFRAMPAGGNGGATAQGVTAKSIKIAQISLDSNALGAACPRCGDKEAPKITANALVEAWRRDGKLPIYGRDFEIGTSTFGITAEEARNACVTTAQQFKPFAAIGQGFDTTCTGKEFHILSVTGTAIGGRDTYAAAAPYAYSVQATFDQTYRNFAHFLDQRGLLKGQVLGLYSPNTQHDLLATSLKSEIAKLGGKLAIEVEYDPQSSNASDAVAVQKFRTSGVTTALIMGAGLTEPAGFQTQAEAQGYRPKYPVAETAIETVDAVGDVAFNAAAEQDNVGMRTQAWEWSRRNPAQFAGNATAQYCLDAYNDDAEIRQLLSICGSLEVVRQAIQNAGPQLTQATFLRGLQQIKGMETSQAPKVSYGPGRFSGQDGWIPVVFKKERANAENNLWHATGPWAPWFVG